MQQQSHDVQGSADVLGETIPAKLRIQWELSIKLVTNLVFDKLHESSNNYLLSLLYNIH